MAPRLSVNVDHVATLRQARGVGYPDPVEAARAAESAGASGVTAHLRSDRRHIQDRDVARLRESVEGKLNLEMAATEEMLQIALQLRPHQVTLVPERPDEMTTEGGLDLARQGARVQVAVERLGEAGIDVSLFLDPDLPQLHRVERYSGRAVRGFEINTDAYTRAGTDHDRGVQLRAMREMAQAGADLGLEVYAGHGLTTGNVGPVAALPHLQELNIGHFLVARSVLVGIEQAVREMLEAMAGGAGEG